MGSTIPARSRWMRTIRRETWSSTSLVCWRQRASPWTLRCPICSELSSPQSTQGKPHFSKTARSGAPRCPLECIRPILDSGCGFRICFSAMDRRTFLQGAATSAAALALPHASTAAATADERDFEPIWAQITKLHDEAVQRLQEWIHQPSIAAENRGVSEGCDLTMRFLREAGFSDVSKIPTNGQPGIFATLDSGAPRTLGLYFMYDVKQVDPAEWSSPPWDAKLVEKPELGTILVG